MQWAPRTGYSRADDMASPYLDDSMEALLLTHCHRRHYRRREMILHGGSVGDSLLYLLKGAAKVAVINGQGQEMIVTYLGPGEFAGEMGVYYPERPRSAWVMAHSDCEVAMISYTAFHTLAC